MPTNLTDVSAFTDPVQVPTAGDPVSSGPGSYLRTALQSLANRTRYLFDGVPRIRNVANSGALKALAGAADGDVAILDGGQLYFYTAGATVGTDLTGYRYDSVVTSGFWASPLYYITTGTPLRQDVSVLPPPNRIVQDFETTSSSPSTQTWASGSTWRSTDATITLASLEVGDIVKVTSNLSWSVDTNTEVFDARIYVSAPGGAAAVTGTTVTGLGTSANNLIHALALEGRYVVTDAGSHTFTAQVHGDGGGAFGFTVYSARSIRGLVIRP